MLDLDKINTTILMDMLALYTADYTKMLSVGAADESIKTCETAITALQSAIQKRKTVHS